MERKSTDSLEERHTLLSDLTPQYAHRSATGGVGHSGYRLSGGGILPLLPISMTTPTVGSVSR